MQEMRTFEVGFKDKPRSSSYSYKFSVGAETAEEAVEKGRKWVEQDHMAWFDEDGAFRFASEWAEEDELDTDKMSYGGLLRHYQDRLALRRAEELERINNLHLARVYDEGTLII